MEKADQSLIFKRDSNAYKVASGLILLLLLLSLTTGPF